MVDDMIRTFFIFFFFSSRRRHTRYIGDWSSDVCSSDLVRQIQVGIDVDGDGAADLDAGRIYYFGQSFGGMYGTIFLGIERDVHVGVPNVPGGGVIDIIRLSPGFRFAILTPAVAARGLLNLPPLPNGTPQFNENSPLRDLPALINTVPGAMALQDYFEQSEWGSQLGNPVAYAPYLRKSPLKGNAVKSVIYQIAKGDQTVPNPTKDRKSTRLNSSHRCISYAVFCLKQKTNM